MSALLLNCICSLLFLSCGLCVWQCASWHHCCRVPRYKFKFWAVRCQSAVADEQRASFFQFQFEESMPYLDIPFFGSLLSFGHYVWVCFQDMIARKRSRCVIRRVTSAVPVGGCRWASRLIFSVWWIRGLSDRHFLDWLLKTGLCVGEPFDDFSQY